MDELNILKEYVADYKAHNKTKLNTVLYDWYYENYSEDKDGLNSFKNKNATFIDLLKCLANKEDVYKQLFGDSTVRERLFNEASKLSTLDYDIFYGAWLQS